MREDNLMKDKKKDSKSIYIYIYKYGNIRA